MCDEVARRCDGCRHWVPLCEQWGGEDFGACRLVDAWDAARGRHYVDCTACRFGSRAEGLPEGHPMATLSRELWRTGAAEACQRCPVCGAEVQHG